MTDHTAAEAAKQVRKWTAVRNEAIRAERADKSLRQLAVECELSPQAISNICRVQTVDNDASRE